MAIRRETTSVGTAAYPVENFTPPPLPQMNMPTDIGEMGGPMMAAPRLTPKSLTPGSSALHSDDMKAKLAKEKAIPPGGSAAWMDGFGRRWKDGKVIYDPESGKPDPTLKSAIASGAWFPDYVKEKWSEFFD